jgi:RimJ/RimL family protein N-acetyltransferase
MIETSLYDAQTIRLAAVVPDSDSRVISEWTSDLEIARHFLEKPARPLSAFELKKYFEAAQKKTEENGREFMFAIRSKDGDDLEGLLKLNAWDWTHGGGMLQPLVPFGENRWRILDESIRLGLVYAFEELNLFRVNLQVPEFDDITAQVCVQAGFRLEVRQREIFYRHGRYWDLLDFGLICKEWTEKGQEGSDGTK